MAALLAQKEHARIYETKDLNAMNYTGMTPMHLATLAQSRDCLWYLKELGADVDIRDGKRGGTPLHYAIEMHNLRLVTFLVFECKADVNPVTYDGYSPLHTASGYGLDAIVALLIAAGADVTVINDEGETPKDTATTTAVRHYLSHGNSPLTDLFLEQITVHTSVLILLRNQVGTFLKKVRFPTVISA
jgi:ankyrin repeat protein